MTDVYLPRPGRLSLPRYSLRTLLVSLTLLGVWLGVQVKWIKDRHAFAARHLALATEVNAKRQALQCGAALQLQPAGTRPLGLCVLGEPAVPYLQVIVLREKESEIEQFDDEEGKRAKSLFPEAQVDLRTVHFYPESKP